MQYLFSVALIHLQKSSLLLASSVTDGQNCASLYIERMYCTVDVKTAITVKARRANDV